MPSKILQIACSFVLVALALSSQGGGTMNLGARTAMWSGGEKLPYDYECKWHILNKCRLMIFNDPSTSGNYYDFHIVIKKPDNASDTSAWNIFDYKNGSRNLNVTEGLISLNRLRYNFSITAVNHAAVLPKAIYDDIRTIEILSNTDSNFTIRVDDVVVQGQRNYIYRPVGDVEVGDYDRKISVGAMYFEFNGKVFCDLIPVVKDGRATFYDKYKRMFVDDPISGYIEEGPVSEDL